MSILFSKFRILINYFMNKDNSLETNYSGLDELLNLEVMNNYNTHIVDQAMKHVKDPKKVVDFGSGIGTLALIFLNSFSIEPICVENDKINISYLRKRKLKTLPSLSNISDEVDLIFSSNVLEHIEDDLSILRAFNHKLCQNGKLFLYLPAHMFLWSKLDESVGHFRRYEFKELKEKCKHAGFKIDKFQYSDSLGFFATFLLKIFGYKKSTGLGSVSSLNFYDKWLFPISKFLDLLGLRYLIGKNIIIVATKTNSKIDKE